MPILVQATWNAHANSYKSPVRREITADEANLFTKYFETHPEVQEMYEYTLFTETEKIIKYSICADPISYMEAVPKTTA